MFWFSFLTAFSPLAGPMPSPLDRSGSGEMSQRSARVDKAIMAGVDHVPPLRGYSTRSKKQSKRCKSSIIF